MLGMRSRFAFFIVAFTCVSGGAAWAQTQEAPEYTNYHGIWRGRFLFAAEQATGRTGAPAQVHNGLLDLSDDGALRASIPDAGCVATGSSSAFVSSANASLDLTLAKCTDLRFNGHFVGKLLTNPLLHYASVRLAPAGPPADDGGAELSAIVRR